MNNKEEFKDTDLYLQLRGFNKNRSELQNFCAQNIEEILQYLPHQILYSGGDLNKLFPGLLETQHKIKVVDIVLEVLRKKSVKLNHGWTIISRVCLELPRLPSDAVVKWCNDSVESITKDTDVNMIWRDVLPECLNAIRSLDVVKYNDVTMTAAEYRKETLKKLLECEWTDRQLVELTAMFKDLQLTRQEHRMFVLKICSFIRDMLPDSLPPLVHQLLKLCKLNNVEVVLAHLSHYFNIRHYRKLAVMSQDSESTTMDLEDIEQFSVPELQMCLSTCMFHVTDAAEPESLRRQLRAWPRSQLMRDPFVVSVALAMIDKGIEFKTVCLDVLRSAVEQSVMDEIRRKESAWMQRVLPSDLDLDEVLNELATGGGQHRSTWMGVIHLSLALLGGPRGGEARGGKVRGGEAREGARGARACAAHGATTLARLAKAHSYTAPQILDALADRLAASSSNLHYIECLRLLCKKAPLSVEPCGKLCNILQSCQGGAGADGVFDAVHPLLNYSERVRDALVIACRKGLYSRDSGHRCLAASGILTVLRHLRASGATSTQDSDDQHSQCSQSYMSVLTVDVHASQQGASVSSRATKDTICHEMVSILRRCLGQDAAVKQLLYSRWYSCVKDKPNLHNTLLEMLYEHLTQYLPEDGQFTLQVEKCVQVTPTNAVLIEPIGYLLYLIAQLLKSTSHDVENIMASQRREENLPRTKLKKIMEDLSKCNLLAQIDMENLKTSEGTVECQATSIKVQQLLQVYEALVAHHVMQWTPGDGRADNVYHLYKEYTQLLDNTKSPTKASKKASKLNDTMDSLKSRRSQASGKSPKKSDKKEKKNPVKTVKDKNVFKPLPCLWDLKICRRILELLYSPEVHWSSKEQRTSLRGRGVVHRWVAREVAATLARDHAAHAHAHAPPIANVLYTNCLCKFLDLYDFDDETSIGCLEMFDKCLNLLCTPKYNIDPATFLSKITGCNVPPAVNKAKILTTLRGILYTGEHSLTQGESAVNKRLLKITGEVIVTVLKIPTESHVELKKEISQLESHVRDTSHECVSLVTQLLATVAAQSCETTLLDDLLKRLTDVLTTAAGDTSDVTQSTQEPVQFRWVRVGVASELRKNVAAHVLSRLACVKHSVARARDLAAALPLAVDSYRGAIENELKEARVCSMLQMCQVARAVRSLCALRGGAGGAGALAARLLGLAVELLRTLDTAAAKEAGLENLLKLLGNRFTLVLCDLREQLEGKLVARVVRAAEGLRSQVFRLDKKGHNDFKKYVTERITVGMAIQTNGGESPTADMDTTRDGGDETMDVDSDADTEKIGDDNSDDNMDDINEID